MYAQSILVLTDTQKPSALCLLAVLKVNFNQKHLELKQPRALFKELKGCFSPASFSDLFRSEYGGLNVALNGNKYSCSKIKIGQILYVLVEIKYETSETKEEMWCWEQTCNWCSKLG